MHVKARPTKARLIGLLVLVAGCAPEEPLSAPPTDSPPPVATSSRKPGKKTPTPTAGRLASP